jgi:hypothetical protein
LHLGRGGSRLWNGVRILGTVNATTTILKSTSFSEERKSQSAGSAGANWQTKTWSGETMDGFGVNTARSFLGKNVNLHLKDGSVIVNVQLSEIMKDEFRRENFLTCIAYGKRNTLRVPLKSIAWAELLNLNFILVSG